VARLDGSSPFAQGSGKPAQQQGQRDPQAAGCDGNIAGQGGDIIGGTPAQFSTFLKSDVEKWAKLVKEAGISLE
jgi:hypothetical protein